ncbi:MAG: hypothetical protein U0872_13730 [Planctomycetaceae bacterium]
MPRMGLSAAMLCALAATSSALAAPGCPFCPPTQPTFSEQLAESDAACLVKWVSVSETKSGDEIGSATTTFEVVEPVRTGNGKLSPGTKITVDFLRMGRPGELFVLFGKTEETGIGWSAPVEVAEDSFQYIRQAPALEVPPEKRLKYFLKFLETSDSVIANDAFAEFSRAKYEDMAQLAATFPREKLRRWLESPETSKVRLGFYGLLLGLCGNDDDANFLAEQIFAPVAPDDVRLGIDGMMGGYLLLTRSAGLQRLVDGKMRDPETPSTDLFAVLNALRFTWEYCRDRLPAAELRQALELFLDRSEFAELVLPDLARWKDWSVLDRLISQYGQDPFDYDAAKLKIIQFAQACAKDKSTEGMTPEHVTAAKMFLARVESESPNLIRQTRLNSPLR